MNISPVSVSLLQSQLLGSLIGSSSGASSDGTWASIFSLLLADSAQAGQLSTGPISLPALSAAGRNMALFDPESAYRMMTVINEDEVSYQAQFAELGQMPAYVSKMQDAGQGLASIALSTGNDSIKTRLQKFAEQYNNWIQRFDPDLQPGGLLADTQAAHASRFELEQNVNNRFFGVKDGVHGLGDLGLNLDPVTGLASLDTAKLDAMLATNKQGVMNTVQEFSANFTKSASLLNSNGNFILKQLDNLNRAIHYIADNKASLQAEFGAGNAARPTGQVARALAAYNQAYGASAA